MDQPLLIVGASARAAAWSAWRAGLRRLQSIDLFADLDLQRICDCSSVAADAYPAGIPAIARALPAGPLLYTGGLENHPRLIAELARDRVLWGNDAPSLRRVRDPFLLAQELERAGLPHPAVAHDVPREAAGRWLRKRRRGAGGLSVRVWHGQGVKREEYLQEFVPGTPHAAVFCGLEGRQALLLGLTRQLVGEAWTGAAPFQYCGSLGPLPPPTDLDRLGSALTQGFGLRGLFGVDLILNRQGMFPVEVNPRYSASIEVLERATGLQAIAWHRAAFGATLDIAEPAQVEDVCGKAIVFAREDAVFPDSGPWDASLHGNDAFPDFADIPPAGAKLRRGQPVLTVFARATSAEACLQELKQRTAEVERILV